MLQLVVLACCLLGLAAAAPPAPYDLAQADKYFQDFMSTHHKQYSSESEKMERFEIFKQNLERINEQNRMDGGAVFAVNKFSDLTIEEFVSSLGCLRQTAEPAVCNASSPDHNRTGPVPDTFDWRTENKVTEVKDQLLCGSCWAFSTTGNVEGQYAIVHNELKGFSESQLVDCDMTDYGCNGGFLTTAMAYLHDAGGIMTEDDYPYRAHRYECKFNKTKIQAKVTGCHQFELQSEEELKETLYRVGPLSIGIDATSFMTYDTGIIKNCTYRQQNHGVLLIGYGTENGTAYWTIKNSWDDSWGEDGYGRIKRNVNACGIMAKNDSSIVTGLVE